MIAPHDGPRCFISYSWDDEKHIAWVEQLATRIESAGLSVVLDRWDTHLGMDLNYFMERSIQESDFVLLVCTPKYKQKAEMRKGGVGYEGLIISSELFEAAPDQRKFFAVLRAGERREAIPIFLGARKFVDLRSEDSSERGIEEIIKHAKGVPSARGRETDEFQNELLKAAVVRTSLEASPKWQGLVKPRRVFLNFPISLSFEDPLPIVLFTSIACGFGVSTPYDQRSGARTRLDTIMQSMIDSDCGIHALSGGKPFHTDTQNRVFELGLWMAFARTGQPFKPTLLLEGDKFSYQRSISDLGGMDIFKHDRGADATVKLVRDWLRMVAGDTDGFPGSVRIVHDYQQFLDSVGNEARKSGREIEDLSIDFLEGLMKLYFNAEE